MPRSSRLSVNFLNTSQLNQAPQGYLKGLLKILWEALQGWKGLRKTSKLVARIH